MPRPSYESFSDMPVGLRRYLFSQEFADADKVIAEKYKLTQEQKELLGDDLMDAVFNDLSLKEAMDDIRASVVPNPVEEAKWKEFAIDVIRLELWPIRELFADELSFWLSDMQIGTGGWPTSHVLLKPLTYSGAVTELSNRVGVSIMGPQMRERMRDLIVSKIKGVRADSQIREALMRAQDFGGLGLDAKQADAAIVSLNEILESVEVLSENEFADWLAEQSRKETEQTQAQESLVDASVESEDPDIVAIKAKMSSAPLQPPSVLETSVENAMKRIANLPPDEYLQRRLRNVISSRLRDVRNAVELRQILVRDSKVGGVGMLQSEADAVVAQVEAAYQEFHASIMEEEKKKLEQQTILQQQKIEERKRRESEEHAKWYQEKILAKKQAEDTQAKLAEQMRQTFASHATTPAAPVDEKARVVEQKRFGELVPAVAMGAAPIQTSAAAAPAQAVAAPFQAPAASSAQAARPEVKVSKATVNIQTAAPAIVKPKLDDIKPAPVMGGSEAPRLVGLTGELSALSLTEFRRMAKTPDEAAQKILSKLDTLAQESFEKRVEGIRAFQASPLQGAYMALVAESFKTGKPVAQLADEKRAQGGSGLSSAEIAAVLSLNSKLHF